jgi:cytochrome c biogenesis protein CcdA/thiol-disulfide isomerase/thioredoxin
MTLFFIAYCAGVLTIATPCILPILPFVLARVDEPFKRGGLPMLLAMAFAFAGVASLASFAGAWAIDTNRAGRLVALAVMTFFGLSLLLPVLAARLAVPIVAIGSRLSSSMQKRTGEKGATASSSALLGLATGFVWAPCTGPILGVILTGAALRGPSVDTALLLLTYGLGAGTSLAAGLFFGGRLLVFLKQSAKWGDGLRRVLGGAMVAGALTLWLGLDTGLLTHLSSVSGNMLEQDLIATMRRASTLEVVTAAHAGEGTTLSAPLRSLLGAQQWLNTPPLRPEALRGKVVLVNFWTYSCINCLRMLPYVRTWAEQFQKDGLVVIGVETPEFAFEKDIANVQTALTSLGVTYPIATDNNFAIWKAFDNDAWPALYFFARDGRLIRRMLGEGDYPESERLIQRLLLEAGDVHDATNIVDISGQGTEAAGDAKDLRSAETYIGYAQATNFAAPYSVREDSPSLYRTVAALPLNRWGLTGLWTIEGEFAALDDSPGHITFRFHARDLHLVLAHPSGGRAIRFRVTLDGQAPGVNHGFDTDAQGWGSVQDDRLYQLVRQAAPVVDRTFEIEFFGPGVRAYAFTFG